MVDEQLAVHGRARHTVDLGKGRILHAVFHQPREIPRRGIMPAVAEPVRICEVRVRHAELARLLVHARGKTRAVAGDVARQHLRRVVARHEQQPRHKLAHGAPLTGLEIHGRAFDIAQLAFYLDLLFQWAALYRDDCGHELCRARHRQTQIRVLFIEHTAVCHNDSALRADGGRGLRLGVASAQRAHHREHEHRGDHRPRRIFCYPNNMHHPL